MAMTFVGGWGASMYQYAHGDPSTERFDFTAAAGRDGLLLPAVQSARETAGDGSVMPGDAQGIIAVLIGLMDDPRAGDEKAGDGSLMPDDVIVGGRIITAEDWG